MATITRDQAISRLREQLLARTDEDNSICKVAAEQHIFCNGFDRYSEDELRERYAWIARKRPGMTREELEQIANDWQVAQQDVKRLPLACDVQRRVHDTCGGWDDFSNEQLGTFYRQLTGEDVRIV